MTFHAAPGPDRSSQEAAMRRGGFLGFLTTLPGILAALATVVSAAGGIYIAHLQKDTPPAGPTSTSVTFNVAGAPVPADTGLVDTADLISGSTAVASDDEVTALVAACADGDPEACAALLDQLALECYEGYGISCDVLYQVSEVGSDYEDYGATCGGRYDWEYAGVCSEL
jgi:hypothetical protein